MVLWCPANLTQLLPHSSAKNADEWGTRLVDGDAAVGGGEADGGTAGA